MVGLLQDWPLTVPKVLEHANTYHGDREVVTRLPDGSLHRYTYADLRARAKRCANVLSRLGVTAGDVVAWVSV